MKFYSKKFKTNEITLYPLGDWHNGSEQFQRDFALQIIDEIKNNKNAYWVGMGDLTENALIGSKSDVYTQNVSPQNQITDVVKMLKSIREKGLFMIGGNHGARSHRVAGIHVDEYIANLLDLPYLGFSSIARLQLEGKTPNNFTCYFHHNYGGGVTRGGKVNRSTKLRHIVPNVDATFSGHFHITSRIASTWFEAGNTQVIQRKGYDYIIGSALNWSGSYAEEKAFPPAVLEHIKVTFISNTCGRRDNRKQIYEVI